MGAIYPEKHGCDHFPPLSHIQGHINHAIGEQAILADLQQAARSHGLLVDDLAVACFYITLKSGSTMLLVGPPQTGKLALIESAGEVLIDDLDRQCQKMVGHARWASGSQNVSVFVEAQTAFNTQKLVFLLEEAARPENKDRLFIACLMRVSPAELHSLFAAPGLLLFLGAEPIPFPPNFRLIGTIDAAHFRWWTPALLLHTAVILWPGEALPLHRKPLPITQSGGSDMEFLRSSIRHEQVAYARLMYLLGRRHTFRPLMQIVKVLDNHDIYVPREVINRASILIANAWSQDGDGLLAPSLPANLEVVLDLALAQYILPWVATKKYPGPVLCQQLNRLLDGRFPQAAAFLQTL